MTLFIDIDTRLTHHTFSVRVVMMECAELLALFYWLQYRFVCVRNCVERLKRETMQRVRSRTQRKPYQVFAPNCKQCTGFFALLLHSNHSRHSLYIIRFLVVIESHESTPNDWQSSSIWIKTALRGGVTRTGLKSIRLEPV